MQEVPLTLLEAEMSPEVVTTAQTEFKEGIDQIDLLLLTVMKKIPMAIHDIQVETRENVLLNNFLEG